MSEDIEDFDYTPKPEYEGAFTIFNEENEVCHIRSNRSTNSMTQSTKTRQQ